MDGSDGIDVIVGAMIDAVRAAEERMADLTTEAFQQGVDNSSMRARVGLEIEGE